VTVPIVFPREAEQAAPRAPMHTGASHRHCRADGRRQTSARGQIQDCRRYDLPLLPDVCHFVQQRWKRSSAGPPPIANITSAAAAEAFYANLNTLDMVDQPLNKSPSRKAGAIHGAVQCAVMALSPEAF